MTPKEQNHDLTAQQFGELDSESAAKLATRLAEDAELTAEADDLGQLLELLATDPPADTPTALDDTRRAEILAAAVKPVGTPSRPWWPVILPLAAAASIVLLGTWLTRSERPHLEMASAPTGIPTDTTPQASAQEAHRSNAMDEVMDDALADAESGEERTAPIAPPPAPIMLAESPEPAENAPRFDAPIENFKKSRPTNEIADVTVTAEAESSAFALDTLTAVEFNDDVDLLREDTPRFRSEEIRSASAAVGASTDEVIIANASANTALLGKAPDHDIVADPDQISPKLAAPTTVPAPQVAAVGEKTVVAPESHRDTAKDDSVLLSGAAPVPGAAQAIEAGAAPPQSLSLPAGRQRFGSLEKASAARPDAAAKRESDSRTRAARGGNPVDAAPLPDVQPPKALLRKLKRAAAKGSLPLVLPFSRDGIDYVGVAIDNARATKLAERTRALWETIDVDNGAHYWVLRRDQAQSLGLQPSPK